MFPIWAKISPVRLANEAIPPMPPMLPIPLEGGKPPWPARFSGDMFGVVEKLLSKPFKLAGSASASNVKNQMQDQLIP